MRECPDCGQWFCEEHDWRKPMAHAIEVCENCIENYCAFCGSSDSSVCMEAEGLVCDGCWEARRP